MKKFFSFLLMLTMILVMSASVVGCSSSGDDEEEEEYVPVESPFAKLLREKPVHQLSYSHGKWGTGSFSLQSDPMAGNCKTDYYTIGFNIKNAPVNDMYNGRYEIESVSASVWGWTEQWQPEYKKHELSTWENNQPVKGAWAEIKTLDKGDEYGRKTFSVKLHVDEMTEENGDYARYINISFTGRDTGPMLVN